ncbi:MAG: hypothetical protein KJO31_17840 [Gammaproteobacteria bacterium]|nr:hypothetical protein [Gammaproteobacteria bacterium]
MLSGRSTNQVLLGSAILTLILPTLVFIGSALYRDMGFSAAFTALGEQYASERSNLFVVSMLGLAPLLVTGILLSLRRLIRKTWQGSVEYAWGGIIPTLVVTSFVNLEYWPSYLPARQFLGFPHGLEFVIGPLIIAPVGVIAGFAIAWMLRKRA